MIILEFSKNFLRSRKKFVKNNPNRAKNLIKAIKIFVENPSHPSLNLEKLSGITVWTIRLSQGNRIFFIWKNKTTALFIDIGPHDKYRKY